MAVMRRVREDFWSKKLKQKREFLVGVFDTKLKCNCGKDTIKDHVEEISRTSRDDLYGPGPSIGERYRSFQVGHSYYCDSCGAMYHGHVIEGRCGYKPREWTTGKDLV